MEPLSPIFDLEIRHVNESIVENREGHRLPIPEFALRSKAMVSRTIKHLIKDLIPTFDFLPKFWHEMS